MKAIRAALIYTPQGFISRSSLLIEGDRVQGVCETGLEPADATIESWGQVALVPGTINAHGHAFQHLLRGFADDRVFESWRDDVLYPFSMALTPDDIYAGALFAFSEALLNGITTTVDFFYLNDDSNRNAELVAQAAKDVGIRLVMARAFYDSAAPTKAPDRFREPVEVSAARCRALFEQYLDDPLVSVQPAPHSLHAVAPENIAVARDLALDLGVPFHIHVAEAEYERRMIQDQYGATPVRVLAKAGLLGEDTITVHSVWVDDEEIDLLAQSRAGVVHCPGANAFLGDGIARITDMIDRGVRVALGCDGGCANNRQSIFDEMRLTSLLAKAQARDGGAFDAGTAFYLGTRAGADLLGLKNGSLEPGRLADLVALDLTDLSLYPRRTMPYQIVNSMQSTAIERVMVGGEVVAGRGELLKYDLEDVRDRVARTTGMWDRP